MPSDAESLLRELPGVGKYTAGAIASIAYEQKTGLVDGNVIRVLCRMRLIGADSTSNQVTDTLWHHANSLVDPDRAGDFNQALMELGATVCTPKNPSCSTCPANTCCKAWAQVQHQKELSAQRLSEKTLKNNTSKSVIVDIECLAESCHLCLPEDDSYDIGQGVMNYPRKGKKKAAREERTLVCVLCRQLEDTGEEDDEFFIVQRPNKGLLAGLWEFPNQLIEETSTSSPSLVLCSHGLSVDDGSKQVDVGEVVHIFSHIHQTYVVKGLVVKQSGCHVIDVDQSDPPQQRWVTKQQFMEAAVSTAMKKVFKAFEAASSGKKKEVNKNGKAPSVDKNQRSIASFFKPK